MAIRWTLCISLTILSVYILESSAQAVDTRLEVSFVVNPVPTKSDAVLQCKVWDVRPTDNVGISRYNNNGMNTVLYRNGATLEDTSDHISLDVLPDQTDGAMSYTITISEVDSLSDGGLYTCFVLTVDGLVQAIAAANLEVTPPVYPICEASTPDNGESYFAKSDITLTCTSDMPSVSNVQWVHQDDESVMEQQISKSSDGKTVKTTLTQTLSDSDNGTSFRCMVISNDPSKNGSDCVVGPITVLKSNRTSTEITRIAGLPLMVFIIIIVLVVLAFVVCIIVLIVCCRVCLGQRSSNISHSSSKSYSMHGLGNTGDSTLSREGTLPDGREVYNPVRPAPPPPATSLGTLASTSDNHGNDTRRLSGIEMALMSAVTHSLGRKKTAKKTSRSDSVTPLTSDTEAIYANTTLGAISEEDHDHSGGGVINPSYEDNNGESFAPLRQPIMPYQPVEYGNLSDLSINVSTDNGADYYSTQSDEKPKPKPLPTPKPKPTIESSARPAPLPQTAFSQSPLRPVAKPKPANKPVPVVPKPAIQTPPKPIPRPKPNVNANGMPSKAPPPLPKPSDLSTARPVPPPKPSNGLNDVAPSVPSRPVPPPRPSYDIMEDGPPPAPPRKPMYQI